MQALRLQLKLCTLPLTRHARLKSFSIFDVLNFYIYAVTDLASITGTGG
jgi:hypothetical protein